MTLQPFRDSYLPELMTWFPDEKTCQTWGGTEFRFPFTETSFREDAKLANLPTWALVEDDGALVGFGQCYLRAGRCHFGRLAIAPGQRGRGYGTRLIREMAERGRADLGVDSLSLFVLPGNEQAQRLYERLGFSVALYPEPSPATDCYIYMVATELQTTSSSARAG